MAVSLSERQQAALFAAILIVAIGGLYATAQFLQPARVSAYVVHLPRLEIDGVGWSIRYAPVATPNNTAFGLLLEAGSQLGFSVSYVAYEIPQGMFVTAINGSTNGEGGRYWQYWVNGAYATIAADHQPLHDSDVVRWTFAASQEGA